MKWISFALFACLMTKQTGAQSLSPLRIGDTLPAVNISYLSGDTVKTVPLRTMYKHHFLIIDFWATWCASCIRAMARADSVSAEFGSKVKILPVTYESPVTVKKFVDKNKVLSTLALDFVVSDSLLMGGYFKFVTLPHEVWIDTQGVVRAITYADEITSENLDLFVNNQSFFLNNKEDDITFNMKEPLTTEINSFLYRSVLTTYKPGIENILASFTHSYIKGEKQDRFLAINKDILSLFYAAYSQNEGDINFDRINMHLEDSSALSPFLKGNDIGRQEINKHSYCYELILPKKVSKKTFFNYLLEDLNRLFPFVASIEKRKKICWVLINKDKSKNPTTLGMKPELIWDRSFIKKMNNQTMDVLTSYLNWNMDLPVIDESNFSKSFDMNLDLEAIYNGKNVVLDLKKVRKSLQQYGFDLIKTKRLSDVLVIKGKTID